MKLFPLSFPPLLICTAPSLPSLARFSLLFRPLAVSHRFTPIITPLSPISFCLSRFKEGFPHLPVECSAARKIWAAAAVFVYPTAFSELPLLREIVCPSVAERPATPSFSTSLSPFGFTASQNQGLSRMEVLRKVAAGDVAKVARTGRRTFEMITGYAEGSRADRKRKFVGRLSRLIEVGCSTVIGGSDGGADAGAGCVGHNGGRWMGRRDDALLMFALSSFSLVLLPTLLSLPLSPTFPWSFLSPFYTLVLIPLCHSHLFSGKRLPPPLRSIPMTTVVVLSSHGRFDG